MNETAGRGRREWRLAGIIFFALLALVVLYATGLILWPFLSAIMLGAILVTLTYHWYERLRTRFGGRSTLAAVAMLLILTLLLIIPAVILGALLVQQAGELIQHFQSPDAQRVLHSVDIAEQLAFMKRWLPGFDPASISPQRLVLPALQQVPGWVARNGAALVGGLAGLIFAFIVVLLSAFFFYVEGEAILTELAVLSPLPARYDREFGNKFKDVIDATFRGQLFTALAQGAATGIGLIIARVPGGFFWGAVAAVVSLLPMFGAAAVWVPATVYLFISASLHDRPYWPAIFLLIWGVLVVSTIDNVVRPWAMKGRRNCRLSRCSSPSLVGCRRSASSA